MKKYLLEIFNEEEWELFKTRYNKYHLGSNLNYAINKLIKQFNEGANKLERAREVQKLEQANEGS